MCLKLQIYYYHILNQWLLGATNGNHGQIVMKPLTHPLRTPYTTPTHPYVPLTCPLRTLTHPLHTPYMPLRAPYMPLGGC